MQHHGQTDGEEAKLYPFHSFFRLWQIRSFLCTLWVSARFPHRYRDTLTPDMEKPWLACKKPQTTNKKPIEKLERKTISIPLWNRRICSKITNKKPFTHHPKNHVQGRERAFLCPEGEGRVAANRKQGALLLEEERTKPKKCYLTTRQVSWKLLHYIHASLWKSRHSKNATANWAVKDFFLVERQSKIN